MLGYENFGELLFLLFQVEVKRALPKEVQQQQAAIRAAVAGRGMIPATIGEPGIMLSSHVSFKLLSTSNSYQFCHLQLFRLEELRYETRGLTMPTTLQRNLESIKFVM